MAQSGLAFDTRRAIGPGTQLGCRLRRAAAMFETWGSTIVRRPMGSPSARRRSSLWRRCAGSSPVSSRCSIVTSSSICMCSNAAKGGASSHRRRQDSAARTGCSSPRRAGSTCATMTCCNTSIGPRTSYGRRATGAVDCKRIPADRKRPEAGGLLASRERQVPWLTSQLSNSKRHAGIA
jgi:hypothetical protein